MYESLLDVESKTDFDSNKILNPPSGSPRGVTCTFIPIDDDWGIKVYTYAASCLQAYNIQKQLAEHGLAPKVGGCFQYGTKHCFVTERVTVFQYGTEYCGEDWEKIRSVFREPIQELTQDIFNATGFHWFDAHPGNYGITKDGRIVAIDFVC